MLTDSIGDFLTQIKNAYMARKDSLLVSHSKSKEAIAKILAKKGYIGSVEIEKEDKRGSKTKKRGKPTLFKRIKINLAYKDKKPSIFDIVRISKPSRRVYTSKENIPRVLGGKGIVILSTSEGIMTGEDARKKAIGGEIICKVW